MPELRICGEKRACYDHIAVPVPYTAYVRHRKNREGAACCAEIVMEIDNTRVSICPADAKQVQALGWRLLELADSL
jgi:hypothetical protein